MAVNVEIKKNKNENNLSVIRRFTRGVKDSGILPKVRSIRYLGRNLSPAVRKSKKLKALEKKEKIDELIKMGKMSQIKTKGHNR